MKVRVADRKIGLIPFLLVMLMAFSPYTELRLFSFLGIPEFSLLIIIIYALLNRTQSSFMFFEKEYFIFTKFWLVFLFFALLGLVANQIFIIPPSGTLKSIIFDSSTYVFLAAGLFSLELLSHRQQYDYSKILFSIFFYTSIPLFGLFVISRSIPFLFGKNLLHYNLFRPFASNIHHISMVVGPLPFFGIFYLTKIPMRKSMTRLLIIILVGSNIIIGLNTGSFKLYLGLIMGFFVLGYFLILNTVKEPKLRIMIILFLAIILLLFIAVNFEKILVFLVDTFREEDIGAGRENLYLSSLWKILSSPLVGYGPGAHASIRGSGSGNDAHNTILTILLQAGPIALIAYIVLWIRIFYRLRFNPYFIAATMPIFIYAIGGDIARRLPMWVYLFIIYNCSGSLSRYD